MAVQPPIVGQIFTGRTRVMVSSITGQQYISKYDVYRGQWSPDPAMVGFQLSIEPGSEVGARFRLENTDQAALSYQMKNAARKQQQVTIHDQLRVIKVQEQAQLRLAPTKQARQPIKQAYKIQVQQFKSGKLQIVPVGQGRPNEINAYTPSVNGSLSEQVLSPQYSYPASGTGDVGGRSMNDGLLHPTAGVDNSYLLGGQNADFQWTNADDGGISMSDYQPVADGSVSPKAAAPNGPSVPDPGTTTTGNVMRWAIIGFGLFQFLKK